jgi:hypothetical protein
MNQLKRIAFDVLLVSFFVFTAFSFSTIGY